MTPDLRRLVHDRLGAEALLKKTWSALVLAACDGRDALDSVLSNTKSATPLADKAATNTTAGAYLTSLTVEGFRGTVEES